MRPKDFLILLSVILLVVIVFSSLLNMIFKVDVPEIESFNFSMHNQLVFDDAFRGTNPEVNLTFAFFMDFKCPACVQMYPDLRKLMMNHEDVNFLFKHLLSGYDENALFSAKAFECAKLQYKGYELADYMFNNQFTQSDVFQYVEELGVELPVFVECLNNTEIETLIKSDSLHASFLKVKGSPTVFLNGIKIEGVHTYEVYDELIKKEMITYEE